MMRLLWWLMCFAAALGTPVMSSEAHTRSQSLSSWQIDGTSVRVSFTISDTETKRLTLNGLLPDDRTLVSYVASRIGASTGDKPCNAASPPRIVVAQTGFRRIEFQLKCPVADGIVLRDDAFFDLVPTHVNLAQVRTAGGFAEQLFTSDKRTVDLSDPHGHELETAGFFQFIGMGIMHIFTGFDHQAFLIGLVLISRRLRDLVFVVTGFTLGHSLTLALAVTGILRPHAEFIDALVALTIVLIGIDNVTLATRKPALIAAITGGLLLLMWGLRVAGIGLLPPALLLGSALFTSSYLMISGNLRDAGRLRLVVTLIFGLIHGFGFAADLLETAIPPARLAELLVGFNLGVEMAQLTLVVTISLFVIFLTRTKLALPRPIVVDVTAAVLVFIGTGWFVSRSFG